MFPIDKTTITFTVQTIAKLNSKDIPPIDSQALGADEWARVKPPASHRKATAVESPAWSHVQCIAKYSVQPFNTLYIIRPLPSIISKERKTETKLRTNNFAYTATIF